MLLNPANQDLIDAFYDSLVERGFASESAKKHTGNIKRVLDNVGNYVGSMSADEVITVLKNFFDQQKGETGELTRTRVANLTAIYKQFVDAVLDIDISHIDTKHMANMLSFSLRDTYRNQAPTILPISSEPSFESNAKLLRAIMGDTSLTSADQKAAMRIIYGV